MVRHNNVVPNQHFKKKWQLHVRTWFNQARPQSPPAERWAPCAWLAQVLLNASGLQPGGSYGQDGTCCTHC